MIRDLIREILERVFLELPAWIQVGWAVLAVAEYGALLVVVLRKRARRRWLAGLEAPDGCC